MHLSSLQSHTSVPMLLTQKEAFQGHLHDHILPLPDMHDDMHGIWRWDSFRALVGEAHTGSVLSLAILRSWRVRFQ